MPQGYSYYANLIIVRFSAKWLHDAFANAGQQSKEYVGKHFSDQAFLILAALLPVGDNTTR